MKGTAKIVADGPQRLLAGRWALSSGQTQPKTFLERVRLWLGRAPAERAPTLSAREAKMVAHRPSAKALW